MIQKAVVVTNVFQDIFCSKMSVYIQLLEPTDFVQNMLTHIVHNVLKEVIYSIIDADK
jgi:hypothetical protein